MERADSGRCEQCDSGERQHEIAGAGRGDVADTAGAGQGGCDGSESRDIGAGEHGERGGEVGIFAPGPNSGEWGAILAAYPHLAPAIEPGFRVLADGVAVALDDARDVQLRCGGNGVVATQAAAAFAILLERASK